MSKCLKLYISVPLFSCSSTYDVQSVCVGFFHHMQQFYGLQRRYDAVRLVRCALSQKRRRFRLWHTHSHKKKGVVQPDDAAVAYICVWPYILRIPSSSTLYYISQLDSNAIHSVKHRPQESKQPTVCRLGSRKPTIYYFSIPPVILLFQWM